MKKYILSYRITEVIDAKKKMKKKIMDIVHRT